MSERTREVVEELLQRMATGDHERTAELFADPVEWALAWPAEGHPEVPWIRPRSSRSDVVDHFRSLATHHIPERNGTSVTDILVDDANAVVFGEIAQTVRSTGVRYKALFALRLTVENGLVSRFHLYEDSLSVARALTAHP